MKIKLFYSYSHKDVLFKEEIEKTLTLLKRDGLSEWSDVNILPGQSISNEIKENIDNSDIIVFLLSRDFTSSPECQKEWNRVNQLDKGQIIIPIIIRSCLWQTYIKPKDMLVLPNDGIPIATTDNDKAFNEVYEGLKKTIEYLKNNFVVREEIVKELEATEFISQNNINLSDIFVFPTLTKHQKIDAGSTYEDDIKDTAQLLKDKLLIIHGEERSSKTALSRHLFFHLLDNEQPVLLTNLKDIERKRPSEILLQSEYEKQFKGDFSYWLAQENKTIVFDDLTQDSLKHVLFAKDYFDHIIVFTTDVLFQSYFQDEQQLIDFTEVEIGYLSHVTQEELIKKRLKLLNANNDDQIDHNDAQVDQIEKKINEIIINNKILPRYPFYILSILQTHEGFMPSNLAISSYGHCYYVLIISNFVKSGIDKSDATLNTCFKFCEQLAYAKYKAKMDRKAFDFELFHTNYDARFPSLKGNLLNRLMHRQYGILKETYYFKSKYMYYFFLGKYLSDSKNNKLIITAILEKSYVESNSLILLFLLHHLKDDELINDILLHTMCVFDEEEPAKLDPHETKMLQSITKKMNLNILQSNVVQGRKQERLGRDQQEIRKPNIDEEIEEEEAHPEFFNNIYKVLKNNKLLGQILRNKGGSLERTQITDIITTIADSGLRLIKLSLSEDRLNKEAGYVYTKLKANNKDEEVTLGEITELLKTIVFFWAVIHIDAVVAQLNIPDLRELIIKEITDKNTPAYDLIGYFVTLDSATDPKDKRITSDLDRLLKKHHDQFIQSVLSLKTQHYLNTHELTAPLEQKICSLLQLQYKPRYKPKLQ